MNTPHRLDPISDPSSLPQGTVARLLDARDAARLHDLRRVVVTSQLPNPDCYRLDAEDAGFPDSHLDVSSTEPTGLIVGILCGAQLVAYGALTLPSEGQAHWGQRLAVDSGGGTPERGSVDDARSVAYLASAMVRQDWRGCGLHHHLIDLRVRLAQHRRRRHLLASTWPGNHGSWGHLTAHGLVGKDCVILPNGRRRLVLHRDLEDPPPRPAESLLHRVSLALFTELPELHRDRLWLWGLSQDESGRWAELSSPPATHRLGSSS